MIGGRQDRTGLSGAPAAAWRFSAETRRFGREASCEADNLCHILSSPLVAVGVPSEVASWFGVANFNREGQWTLFSLVLNGLASGAAQDAADSVSDAVKSAYTKLKQLASATALGGSSARSRAAPGSPNPSDRTRSDTHSSLPVWTPTCRCATFRRPPPMLTRGPRSGMTRPAEAWTGTPHISLRPTSLALPGNYTA